MKPYFLPLIVVSWLASSAHAQMYRSSNYNPYGSSRSSGGSSYSGGISASFIPQVSFGPFGPQLGYATPVGYVMVPAFPGVPSYFGPMYGVNMKGSRVAGIGYLQGSVGSLNSSRYQSSGTGGSSMNDGGATSQYGGSPRAQVKNLEPRRKRFEQFLDERLQVNPEELKQKQQKQILLHSLANPTKQEVTSGAAPNTILESLESMRPQFKEAPEMPIAPELVKELNFTKGSGTGSFGLLRQEGKIPWPMSLTAMTPKDQSVEMRAAIDKSFLEAYQQVSTGKADLETLKDLQRNTDKLSNLVSANIRNMGINDYMEAKQFLKSVDETVTFLKQPDAADWLPGKSKIKPRTVQELFHVMSEKGIRFAPALVGNDNAYLAMHRMLVNFHNAVAPDPMAVKQ